MNSVDPLNAPCTGFSSDDHRSELCAQWVAADAAENSASLAFWFGLVGSIIGLSTLAAAVAAALFAKKAADETKRSADEAAKSSRAALDTHQAYLATERAIVRIQDADFRERSVSHSPYDWELAITVLNYGRSNATISDAHWMVVTGPMFSENLDRAYYPIARFVPVGEATEIVPLPMWDLPEYPFFIIGFIEYETLATLKFRTHFCYKVTPARRDGFVVTFRSHDTEWHVCADMPQDT